MFCMLQSRTKMPGSGLLIGVLPWIMALTSSETIMTLCSAVGKLLDTMSFTYLFIEGDTFMASLSGISTVILSNAFLQIALSNSRLVCDLLRGKGGIHSLYYWLGRSRMSIDIVSHLSIDIYRSWPMTLFLFYRSISTSSFDSSSSSLRLIVAFSILSVLDCSFS